MKLQDKIKFERGMHGVVKLLHTLRLEYFEAKDAPAESYDATMRQYANLVQSELDGLKSLLRDEGKK